MAACDSHSSRVEAEGPVEFRDGPDRIRPADNGRCGVPFGSVVDERAQLGSGVHLDANLLCLLRRNGRVDRAEVLWPRSHACSHLGIAGRSGVEVQLGLPDLIRGEQKFSTVTVQGGSVPVQYGKRSLPAGNVPLI